MRGDGFQLEEVGLRHEEKILPHDGDEELEQAVLRPCGGSKSDNAQGSSSKLV